jgi:hypothetical protein
LAEAAARRTVPRAAGAARRLAPEDVFFGPRTALEAFFAPEAFFEV